LSDSQLEQLAQQLRVSSDGLNAAVKCFNDGLSIPFVARYRKQVTGELDERHLRRLHALRAEDQLAVSHRAALKKLLEERGQLNPEFSQFIDDCSSATELGNWLSLHKRRKLPKAVMEQRRGWYPLAHRVLDGSMTPAELEESLGQLVASNEHLESAAAAKDLLLDTVSEAIAHHPRIRTELTQIVAKTGLVTCGPFVEADATCSSDPKRAESAPASVDAAKPTEAVTDVAAESKEVSAASNATAATEAAGKLQDPKKVESSDRREKRRAARRQKRTQLESKFKHLLGLKAKLGELKTEQVLELDHGDRVRAIVFEVVCDAEPLLAACEAQLKLENNPHAELIKSAAQAAVNDRLLPELLKDSKRDLCSRAAHELRGPLAHSLRCRAMQRPVRARLLSLHSKLRWGWQAAVLDADGQVLALESIPWNQGGAGDQALIKRIAELATQHEVELVALGDSAGARKLDRLFVADNSGLTVPFTIVDTSGVMDFVRSAAAAEMFSEEDPHVRASIAIGRRLQDPLAALLPLPPKDLYSNQPELKTFLLLNEEALSNEFVSCLCLVGVDVNRAPVSVLERVPGLDRKIATQIVAGRSETPIVNRDQLQPLIADPAAFNESIGFLIVMDGDNPFDATGVHPEHYAWADAILESCGLTRDDLTTTIKSRMAAIRRLGADPNSVDDQKWMESLRTVKLKELADKLQADAGQLKQVLIALRHAGNDIRRNSAGPVMRGKQTPLAELTEGTELHGTVLNIVDFGVFVDIGRSETGLIHISRLANGFIRNPRDFVWEGDPIRVWVVSVDEAKNRLALSAIAPGSAKPRRNENASSRSKSPRRSDKPAHKGKRGSAGGKTYVPKAKKKPKVVAPITDGMKEGKEPMRAFSDLLQFYDKKDDKK
jgi:uncharacterized protein